MNLYVGTSGYSYTPWRGKFYPPKFPTKDMLGYYSERFGAVELNGTFYRMPTASAMKELAAQVPADFQFAIKAPQTITHFQRLKNTDDSLKEFIKVASVLRDRLGPLLFGLPPNMKKDTERLRAFLKAIPKKRRVTFEFRHASWLDDEVFDLLRAHGATLCIAESDDNVNTPRIATADWGYLRLRNPEYTDAQLKDWVKWIRKQNWSDVFIFFKHEDEAKGPAFAQRFLKLAGTKE